MRDFQFFTVSCGGPVNHSDVYPSGKTFTWSAAAGKRVSLLSPVVGFLFNRPTPVFIYSPPSEPFYFFPCLFSVHVFREQLNKLNWTITLRCLLIETTHSALQSSYHCILRLSAPIGSSYPLLVFTDSFCMMVMISLHASEHWLHCPNREIIYNAHMGCIIVCRILYTKIRQLFFNMQFQIEECQYTGCLCVLWSILHLS